MREIVKFKVDGLDEIISYLEGHNCEISPVNIQYDTIYVKDLNHTESTQGSVWLRVRKTNEKIELNYKRQSAKKMESEEIEFAVDSYEKANQFLTVLGFQEWVQVNKKRRYAKYMDYNICMDEVEKLGSFIELEILVDEENDIDYEAKLLHVAQELGIDINSRINSHYDTMISELNQ